MANATTNSTFDEFVTETPIMSMPPTLSPTMQTAPSRNNAASISGSTVAVFVAVGVVLVLSIQNARRRNQCGNQRRCERDTKNNHDLNVPNGSTDANVGSDIGGVTSGGDGGGDM